MSNKQLYIVSGCNGAGKTTASYPVLPKILQCQEFVNNIYMPIVDSWGIIDNSIVPREIIAEGGLNKDFTIYNPVKYKSIESYVGQRI